MFQLFNNLSAVVITVIIFSFPQNNIAQPDYLDSINKIDIHTHLSSDAPYLRQLFDSLNFKFTTICTGGRNPERMNRMINSAAEFTNEYPRYYAWLTTFDLAGRNNPGWQESVIKQLKRDFDNGALGVKIWKEIGMDIKNEDGKYILVDDPMFTPIFDFIAAEGKTLLAHLGEPVTSWMLPKPGSYQDKHPEYCFYDKPEKPSYSDLLSAMDHVIERHPDLRYVGAHLASCEFDVDEMSKRFEKYPNFAVEIGGRTRYFLWQARGKVQAFFEKYQDRIMYGTDRFGGMINKKGEEATEKDIAKSRREILARYNFFSKYYATDEEISWSDDIKADKPVGESTYSVKGLALPAGILNKVYYENAVKWFPGVDKGF